MATFTSFFLTVMVLVASVSAAPKKFSLKIPDECKGKGFCSTKPEGYDDMQGAITKLLSSTFIAQSIGDRLGEEVQTPKLSSEDDWHNCPYLTKRESMYAYSHENDTEVDYIIQHDLLVQPIEIIECAYDKIKTDSESQCFQDLGLSNFNRKSICQSTTAKRSLIVYDPKMNQIKTKTYDVPCCCTCVIDTKL